MVWWKVNSEVIYYYIWTAQKLCQGWFNLSITIDGYKPKSLSQTENLKF